MIPAVLSSCTTNLLVPWAVLFLFSSSLLLSFIFVDIRHACNNDTASSSLCLFSSYRSSSFVLLLLWSGHPLMCVFVVMFMAKVGLDICSLGIEVWHSFLTAIILVQNGISVSKHGFFCQRFAVFLLVAKACCFSAALCVMHFCSS